MHQVKLTFLSEDEATCQEYASEVPVTRLSATELLTTCEPEELAGLEWMVAHPSESGLKAFTLL